MPGILGIRPLEGYRMEVRLDNGNVVILNLESKLRTARFRQLRDKRLFDSATTDGDSIRWNDLVEISITEILEMLQSRQPPQEERP